MHKENYVLFKNYLYVFPANGFRQKTFNDFSGVEFGLYRGHCFDRVVVSLNFVVDSL